MNIRSHFMNNSCRKLDNPQGLTDFLFQPYMSNSKVKVKSREYTVGCNEFSKEDNLRKCPLFSQLYNIIKFNPYKITNIYTVTFLYWFYYIQHFWTILWVQQGEVFPDTGPLQDKLPGKYIVFCWSQLLISGFLTKCPYTINGDAKTWPCGGTWPKMGCQLLLEWCMHISETRVYRERGRFFHLSASGGASGGMWRPFGGGCCI